MKKLEKIRLKRICNFKQIYNYLFEKWAFSMSKDVKGYRGTVSTVSTQNIWSFF